MEIIIINKIESFVTKYCEEHKCTKTDLSSKLAISRQGLDNLCSSKNPKLISLVKLALVFECKPNELYDYKIIQDSVE